MATPAPSPTVDLRPAAHFTARSTWLNDPNGLVFHQGVYHLFFQTNPFGSVWGNISWGHATSTDLVTWTEHPIAIPCTDEEAVFSGSAVVDHHNTAGFAGPGQTALVAAYTSARFGSADVPAGQAQSLAYSLDDGVTWTRYAGNPVLDVGSADFRDPKVFWYGGPEGHWVMVVVEAVDRRVAVYTSDDLITWTFASHAGPAHAVGGVWECPDLFPLTVEGEGTQRWALIVSINPGGVSGGSGTQYFIGDFDGWTFSPERLSESADLRDYDWLDFGRDYYAAVSFSNVPDGRRLMVGWASNWDYALRTPTSPWRSAMSLVREVRLVRGVDGRLRLSQRPVLPAEVAARVGGVTIGTVEGQETVVEVVGDATGTPIVTPGSATDPEVATVGGGATVVGGVVDDGWPQLLVARLTVTIRPQESVEVWVGGSDGVSEGLIVTVDATSRRISCDRRRSGLVDFDPAFASVDWAALPVGCGDEVDLLIVADATIVEIFVGDGTVTFTEQVFPSEPYTSVIVRSPAVGTGPAPHRPSGIAADSHAAAHGLDRDGRPVGGRSDASGDQQSLAGDGEGEASSDEPLSA